MANFQTNTRNSYYAVLSLTEKSQSANANSTVLSHKLTLYSGDSHFSGYTIGYRVKINGVQVVYHDNTGNQTSMSSNSSKVVEEGTTTILHNEDGTKTVSVSAEIWTDSGSYLPVYLSCEGSMTLTTILRESTISATDANIGATSMIAVNRKSSGYTHSIQYKFGSLTGYINADGSISEAEQKLTDTYIGFPVPDSFYAQIPNAKSGKCTLTVRTYSGGTQIGGAKTGAFTCTAAESACAPEVTGTVADTNEATKALTGSTGKLVRFCSDAFCTISATAKHSATLKQKRIGAEVISSGNTRTISGVEAESIVFDATDSRGYTGSATVPIDLVPYVKLTCRAVAARVDSTSGKVTLSVSGSYYNGSFGAAANSLTLKYKIGDGAETALTAVVSENTYTAEATLLGLAYNKSYEITVTAADKLSTAETVLPIRKGIPIFNWGENDFEFNVPAVRPCASGALVGTAGQAGYVCIAKIQITDGNADSPIFFEVARRSSREIFRLALLYEASGGTDPAVASFTSLGNCGAFAQKTEAGKWEIYMQKGAVDDSIAVLAVRYNLLYLRDRLMIDCNYDGFLESVPYGAVAATSGGDTICEEGTTEKAGITWHWRKYASGRAECWGTCDEITTNCSTAWGPSYVPGNTDNHAGPFDLPFAFTEIVSSVASPVRIQNDFWLSTYLPGTLSVTPGFNPTRGTAMSGLKFKVAFAISGKYK